MSKAFFTTHEGTSINTNNFTSASITVLELPFGDTEVIITATLLVLFFIFGFFANLLTIAVIITSKKLRSIFNQFILSLCFSDLLSALISWICLYRRTWGFIVFSIPNVFCVIYWGADIWSSYVTSQHILIFAILRLVSISKPLLFNKIKRKRAKIWIVTIWIVAFVTGFIPFAVFSGARVRDRTDRNNPVSRWPACTQNPEWLSTYSTYTKIFYSIFFYVPLITITIVSIVIGIVMIKRRKSSRTPGRNSAKKLDKEKQAILQLTLIVGSFMLGYIPFTAYEFYTINSKPAATYEEVYEAWKKDWLFGMTQYICLRFSECLNPIFYNLASTKMRNETFSFLRRIKSRITGITSTKLETRTTSVSSLSAHSDLQL